MNMSVLAKFKCTCITHSEGGYKQVALEAVCSNTGENADFTRYTPSGTIIVDISPEAAAGEFFTPGKQYYIKFTPAD